MGLAERVEREGMIFPCRSRTGVRGGREEEEGDGVGRRGRTPVAPGILPAVGREGG